MKRLYARFREGLPWITGGFSVIFGNCAAQAIYESVQDLFGGGETQLSWPRLSYIPAFIASVYLLYRQRKKLLPPRTRYFRNEEAERRGHLVLFLSSIRKELVDNGGIPDWLELSGEIESDIAGIERLKAGKPNWPWEMPIRAIRHHLEAPLKTVTLLCSNESIRQAGLFLGVCARYESFGGIEFNLLAGRNGQVVYLPRVSPELDCSAGGFDFESFDELTRAVWFLLKEFKDRGYPDHEIMIDITGGQKPTSIVGAAVTFNRAVKAQYVQTNRPWKVLSYDVIHESGDTGGLGL
jgi:hypothetical protein